MSLDQSLSYRLRLNLLSNGELSVSSAVIHQAIEPVKLFWAKDILPGDVTMHSGNFLCNVSHAEQIHLFYLVSMSEPEFSAGEESLEVALFMNMKFPWVI